jgi:uncharacterized RDD family membrane protein YckC
MVAGSSPQDAAIRWRVRAATFDNLLVYGAYVLLCALLHWNVFTLDHWLVLLLLGVAYHFVLESGGGQTFGKRRYGIQVVSMDGGRASPRSIAIRSALRMFDSLPAYYVSGLISMVRTGPNRRQRLGDVAGGTMVIAVDGRAAQKGTPGWVLYAATLFALLGSIASVYAITQAGKQPLTSDQQAQFIAGCNQSLGGQVLDCTCLLNQLQADGYVTDGSLRNLVVQAQAEELSGRPGAASRELTSASLTCKR